MPLEELASYEYEPDPEEAGYEVLGADKDAYGSYADRPLYG